MLWFKSEGQSSDQNRHADPGYSFWLTKIALGYGSLLCSMESFSLPILCRPLLYGSADPQIKYVSKHSLQWSPGWKSSLIQVSDEWHTAIYSVEIHQRHQCPWKLDRVSRQGKNIHPAPTHRQRLDRSIDRNPTRSTIHLESADFSAVNGHDPQSAFSTSFVGPDPLTSKSANWCDPSSTGSGEIRGFRMSAKNRWSCIGFSINCEEWQTMLTLSRQSVWQWHKLYAFSSLRDAV